MKNTVYIRKKKEDKPVVAICYDFDKTLTHDDMQAQGFIQSVGLSVKDFWKKSNGLALKNGMDQNLAYMYSMCHESYGNVALTKDLLLKYGSKIKLFPGVDTWFERIRRYGEEKDVIVEHYIISSGLKEMIEGTDIAGNEVFEKIYASEFFYEETAVGEIPVWPAQVVNYTNKTQFLFRIEKGVLDINDPGVNDYYPPDKLRVPFSNMIYIGDSDTDIPCMRLVRERGGSSIGVYNPEKGKEKVYKMMREHRVDYFAPADYTEFGELDDIVKAVIDKISGSEPLIKMALANQKEALQAREKCTKEGVKSVYHNDLIINLENSRTFANTHMVVQELAKVKQWTEEEKIQLCHVAWSNSQVRYILTDPDVRDFYQNIFKESPLLENGAKDEAIQNVWQSISAEDESGELETVQKIF